MGLKKKTIKLSEVNLMWSTGLGSPPLLLYKRGKSLFRDRSRDWTREV